MTSERVKVRSAPGAVTHGRGLRLGLLLLMWLGAVYVGFDALLQRVERDLTIGRDMLTDGE